ncbi:uncharacterized protein LOC141656494 [Silene latifolia]|uniref:uncharacterized protein LOC141656494 n=1 Tax=Silene latifolia TaxID=37657 RepID=UPI003D76C870
MSNKVKGLLKGLRYISQIFEEEEDEPEMQIGCPTDVKHVAHIGWDGPAASSPSWIQKFKDGEGPPNGGDQQNGSSASDPRPADQEKRVTARSGASTLEPSPSKRRSDKPRGARRHTSAGTSAADSPKRSSTSETAPSSSKTSRRRKTKTSSKSNSTSTTSDLSPSDSMPGPKSRDRSGSGSSMLKSNDTCSEVDQNAMDDKAGRRIRAM